MVPAGHSLRLACFTRTHAPTLLLAPLPQVNNVAELLLVRGKAQVVKHRAEEERSGAPMHACWLVSQQLVMMNVLPGGDLAPADGGGLW